MCIKDYSKYISLKCVNVATFTQTNTAGFTNLCHVQLSYTATLYKPTNNLLHIQYLSCKSRTNPRSN